MDLLSSVRATVRRYDMLARGDRVVIGVSGGPDSMALWSVLRLLSSDYALELKVVYVDHRLRGEGSRAEAGFIRSMAEKWGVPVEVVRLPGKREEKGSGSVEARIRIERLALLEAQAAEWGANRIALGHQRDDHIETVLINLIRGAGLAGLSGIPPVRGLYVRPLIESSRREILEFLELERVPFCRDRSNLEPTHLRNQVRHGLIPYLEAGFNRSLGRVVVRLANICRTDDEALSAEARAALAEVCKPFQDGEIVLDLVLFGRYNLSVRRRVIRSLIRSLDPGRGEVELGSVDRVLDLAGGVNPGAKLDLGRGLVALREYDKMVIGAVGDDLPSPELHRFNPPYQGGVVWGRSRLRVDFAVVERPEGAFPPQDGPEAWFDPESVAGPLTLRAREPGDSIRPFASKGTVKLSDLFIDRKVPRRQRRWIPLVADRRGIIWVVGHRLADRARVREGSATVLRGRVVWDEAGAAPVE